MVDQATERMIMRASPARCFEVVADFDRYREWAHDIKDVTVVERDDEGRALVVTFRAAAFGRSTSYTLRYDYGQAPKQLSWVEVKGDLTSRLDGSYVFEPAGDDTEVSYPPTPQLRGPISRFFKPPAPAPPNTPPPPEPKGPPRQ